MKRFNIAGWAACGAYQQAKTAINATRDEFMTWLESSREGFGAPGHKTSPFVWFEDGKYLGGRDDTLAWCRKFVEVDHEALGEGPVENVDPWNPSHTYDYDLVVIGGGSGGLACSKEAAKLGARVMVLDYVKPSPHGSKWGLGGTCVNVGCIPKKLYHTAALVGETIHGESGGYGWTGGSSTFNWETLKNNVQDHIKGLNFGYRVQLRETGIKYENKLGRFIDPHTLECVDAKGRTNNVTAARFVIAVGGRPSPIDCPGSEHAISSDDLFSLSAAPGKTCVVGAGYVALECAGFLAGLKQGEVSVLVRSMPLRGFDRDVVDRVSSSLTAHGVKMQVGVLPTNIEKLENGKYGVSVSNGVCEEFDTVLSAVGRRADTHLLGVGPEGLNLEQNPRNGKLICNNEQTSLPHVYAVGDVVEGVPELTPSAIQAGRMLARRLFGSSSQKMDYYDIPTTVFTPLEFGTVGLPEEEAIKRFGAENVDCFVSSFTPLEWSLTKDSRDPSVSCFAKVVVLPKENNRVVGIHIAAPHAGEIIQGFAVALKKGIKHHDILETVGIHPTIAEEFTTMEVLKSSGASMEKSGC